VKDELAVGRGETESCISAYRARRHVFVRRQSVGFCGINSLYERVVGIGFLIGRMRKFRFNILSKIVE
jgi:hypothetical protein